MMHAPAPLTFVCAFLLQLTKDDFHLPTLGGKLVGLGKEVNQGRGFQLVRCGSASTTSPQL